MSNGWNRINERIDDDKVNSPDSTNIGDIRIIVYEKTGGANFSTYIDDLTLIAQNITLDASKTSKNNNITFEITPNDGNEDGETKNTTYLQINQDTPPTFSNAINTSTDFQTGSNFTANITINDNIEID